MHTLYLDYFALEQPPFGLTPNTELFHPLQPHVEALQVLHTALDQGEGFLKVTGEVGTGKTLLCRKLLNDKRADVVFAYLPNPSLNGDELRQALACELHVESGDGSLIDRINQRLIALAHEHQSVVVVIDEAQALSDESLEALRLLGNLETESRKLLQLVLFGQPELDNRLAQPHLRQLRQRITFSYTLRPLLRKEVASYLSHRLQRSGYSGGPLFSASAANLLARGSRGIPRLINILAHKSLMLCYGKGVSMVTSGMVRRAIIDTEDTQLSQGGYRLIRLLFLSSLLVVAVLLAIQGGYL